MRKKRILLLVPIVLVACSIIYTWCILLGGSYLPQGITISTPSINWYCFLLFIVYIACNFDNLVNMYYDHKESKGKL